MSSFLLPAGISINHPALFFFTQIYTFHDICQLPSLLCLLSLEAQEKGFEVPGSHLRHHHQHEYEAGGSC